MTKVYDMDSNTISLTDADKAKIGSAQSAVVQAEQLLGARQMAVADAEANRNQALQQLQAAYVARHDSVKGVMRAHNIDPDNPASGNWNLDVAAMTLTRIG